MAADPVALARDLLRCPSVTPAEGGALSLLERVLKDGGFTGTFVSADGTKDPEYVKQGGEATKGAILSCPCGPATGTFADEYKKKFNADAGTYSAEGYDLGTILVKGIDKEAVGQVAANIRKIRKPEPYKGKGIRYADERVQRKAGKSAK